MNDDPVEIEHAFARELRSYLADGGEEALHRAYELGRRSLERGHGVLETAGALVRALAAGVPGEGGGPPSRLPAAAIEALFLEALSPFEMAYRGAREANLALRRLDEVREEEARRVAGELHDASSLLFAGIHHAVADLSQRLPSAREDFDRMLVLLVRSEEQLRRLAHEFHPAMLDDLGLRPALAYLAENVARRSGLRIEVKGEPAERLPAQQETALYRCTQEALANVVRHAAATRVTIQLAEAPDSFTCRVVDDGAGFDAAAWDSRRGASGLGLRGIRERLAVFDGTLAIRSTPGRGTEIVMSIPLEVPHVLPGLAGR